MIDWLIKLFVILCVVKIKSYLTIYGEKKNMTIPNCTRRDFLKAAGIAAASLAISGSVLAKGKAVPSNRWSFTICKTTRRNKSPSGKNTKCMETL
ncbi:MAG: twin-arginine translocation signal domain-containing protein [Sedimentisphaerales bacterium]|nr:twin-arginine translocation signal domain-containing protein [Sedimentisphaerales bacterium]